MQISSEHIERLERIALAAADLRGFLGAPEHLDEQLQDVAGDDRLRDQLAVKLHRLAAEVDAWTGR